MGFSELIIAYPNGGQWVPFGYVLPTWLKPLVTPLPVTSLKADYSLHSRYAEAGKSAALTV